MRRSFPAERFQSVTFPATGDGVMSRFTSNVILGPEIARSSEAPAETRADDDLDVDPAPLSSDEGFRGIDTRTTILRPKR